MILHQEQGGIIPLVCRCISRFIEFWCRPGWRRQRRRELTVQGELRESGRELRNERLLRTSPAKNPETSRIYIDAALYVNEQAHKSSEDTQVADYARFEKVWAG